MTEEERSEMKMRADAYKKLLDTWKLTCNVPSSASENKKERLDVPKTAEEVLQEKREKIFRQICAEMISVYHDKNLDYGNSFGESVEEFGLTAAVVRIGDKYRRLKSLVAKQPRVKDESVKDTLLDMANYAIMTLIELENQQQ